MSIVPRKGDGAAASSREQPQTLRPEVLRKAPVVEGQAMLDEVAVERTFLNNTSFNVDSFQQTKSLIAGYPEGRIIVVTYYSQNSPVADIQSNIVDIKMSTIDDVHLSWTEIRNFEVRISNEFSYDYDEENNVSQTTSTGIVWPGFRPRIGDFFLYKIRNEKIGIFYITNIKRLALGQDTYHQIDFTLQRWLDYGLRDQLHRQTTQVLYFDKEKFIAGNTSLLSTEGFIQKKDLLHLRSEIVQNYMDRFYSNDMSSFVRPDGVYDPYIVEYWNSKVSILDGRKRPLQLFIAMQNYKKTIWSAMTNNPIKDLSNYATSMNQVKMSSTFWGVNITTLLGKPYLTVGDEEGSKVYPTIDDQGEAILVDYYPYTHYNGVNDIELTRRRSLKDFVEFRRKFYHDFLPFRHCGPHQHPVGYKYCEHDNYKECSKHVECIDELPPEKRRKLFHPPYPIVSTEELYVIWKKLRHLPESCDPPEPLLLEFKSYVEWYRLMYPGTLSYEELETHWRREAFPLDDNFLTRELTEAESTSMKLYIQSYRSKYLPVLTDRELEIVWRATYGIADDVTLDETQGEQLLVFLTKYRDLHGLPPNDGVLYPDLGELGTPILSEHKAQARTPTDEGSLVDLRSILIEEDGDKLIAKPIDLNVPVIYRPKHPKPYHHVHCHDVCHKDCGSSRDNALKYFSSLLGKTVSSTDPTYVFSYRFYNGSSDMDDFESLVYAALTGKEFSIRKVLDHISLYLQWDDNTAFYKELVCLYLIDKSLYWLQYHS